MFDDARAYESFMGRWSALLAPAFLDVVAIEHPTRVLDVGAGTGALASAVADRWPGCSVVGIDPSPGFVAAARERAAADGRSERVRFEVAQAADLPLGDDSVDAALALLVLNFVPDADRAVVEMCRVTRAGGVLAAAVWDYGGGMGALRALWDAAVRLDPSVADLDEGTMPLGHPDELAGLWRRAGLGAVAGGGIEVTRTFPTFDEYWQPFLGGAGPAGAYVSGLSDAGRAALRAEVHADLGPGPFGLTSRAWWVRGTVGRTVSETARG